MGPRRNFVKIRQNSDILILQRTKDANIDQTTLWHRGVCKIIVKDTLMNQIYLFILYTEFRQIQMPWFQFIQDMSRWTARFNQLS